MANINYYTPSGLQKLKDDLERMKNQDRALISKQLEDARSKGDLSENAEYDAAKDAQGMLEMKIAKLQEIISNARILPENKIDTSKVSVLTKVEIKNKKNSKIFKYTLVAEEEADLNKNKISIKSPLGKGLIGKKIGDEAIIKAPSGKITFEILKISQ